MKRGRIAIASIICCWFLWVQFTTVEDLCLAWIVLGQLAINYEAICLPVLSHDVIRHILGECVLNEKKPLTSTRQKMHYPRNPSVSKLKAKAETVLFLYMHIIFTSVNNSPLRFEHQKKNQMSHKQSYYVCLLISLLCVFSTGLPFIIFCEWWISVNCLLIPMTCLYLLAHTSKEVRGAWSQNHLSNAPKFIWLLVGCCIHHCLLYR